MTGHRQAALTRSSTSTRSLAVQLLSLALLTGAGAWAEQDPGARPNPIAVDNGPARTAAISATTGFLVDAGAKRKEVELGLNLFIPVAPQGAASGGAHFVAVLDGANKRFKGTWYPTVFCSNRPEIKLPGATARSGKGAAKETIAHSVSVDFRNCVPPMAVDVMLVLKGGGTYGDLVDSGDPPPGGEHELVLCGLANEVREVEALPNYINACDQGFEWVFRD